MEHGSLADSSASTFSIVEEDHTLANSIKFVLNQDPRVSFCGYSIPHPADNKINIRVQTIGDPTEDVMKDALQDLMLMGQHVGGTFDKAVADLNQRYLQNKWTLIQTSIEDLRTPNQQLYVQPVYGCEAD